MIHQMITLKYIRISSERPSSDTESKFQYFSAEEKNRIVSGDGAKS